MTISQIKKVSWFFGLVLILLTLLGSSMTVFATVPAGSEFPANWSVTSSTTATGTTPSGITVTVTTTGNIIILRRDNLMGVDGGTAPSYFPTTTTHALIFQIPNNSVCSGNSFTGCGTITYSFSKPIMTPILYVASLGKGQGGATWSGFNDAPWTVPSGRTFALESTGSQTDTATLDMSIQNSSRSVGINNPASIPGTTIPPSGSCTKFGCGAYLINGVGSVSSFTFDLGYRGTAGAGQGNDNFAAVFGTTPTPDLAITKSSNGPFVVGQTGANYTLNVANNGLFATSGTITVRDALPTGITANWTGTLNTGGFACTFSGQNVTCTSTTSIAVGGTTSLTLPVNIGSTAAASSINYASIGGGGDAFNSGTAPTAGVTCTDATHCASNTTAVTSGTIIITKDAVPNAAQDFAFTGGLGNFSLDDDANATLPNTRTFTGLAPGTYTVTESAVAGWGLTNLVCTDPTSNTTVNLGTRQAAINVAAGETVSCTYTNTQNPADLSISKTNGQTSYYRGQWINYAITVTNNGPTAANNALFQDPTVSGFVVSNVSCTASGGAVCPTIDATNYTTQITAMKGAGLAIPTFPSGGSVTFMVSGAVDADFIGSLTNTATVTAPAGVNETNSANNSASDTDSQDFTSALPVCTNGADYVEWTGTFASGSGSVDSTSALIPHLPNLTFTTTGGGSITLNTAEAVTATGSDTTWTDIFGSPNAAEITRWHLSLGTFGAPTVQTITFASDAPANQWGFLIADLDVEQIKIEAFDGSGNQYSDAEVHTWYRGVYDVDSTTDGVNLPRWIGPTSPYAMGSGAGGDPPNIPPTTPFVSAPSGADDTSRASIWFAPDMPVRTLRITYQNLGSGSDRLYIASCLQPAPTPDLTIAKSHTPTNFTIGSTGTYNLTVSNSGTGATSGAITVTDTLPTGLTVNGGAAGAVTLSGTNAVDWSCSSNAASPQVITCTSTTAIATGGSSAFSFNVNVGNGVASSLTNNVTVSGGSEPTANNGNNSASDIVTISQTNFGSCDSRIYQAITTSGNTALNNVNSSTNPFTYSPLMSVGFDYNATGYNSADNYIYGLMRPNTNTLVRVGSDGSVVILGAITGLPAISYNSGEFGSDGFYYVFNGNGGNTLYKIDVTTRTVVSSVSLSPSQAASTISDIAWVGGSLYTVDLTGQLKRINPSTGAVTNIGSPSTALTFGAMFGAPNGLFGADNGGSGFYQFDLTTGAATKISNAPSATGNDGAHCVDSNITFESDLAIAKSDSKTVYTAGSTNVYTITVTNAGPFGAQNATISDPLPSGITTASWTCSATGGGSCAASGTGAINDATADIPIGATLTYTMTMTVPSGFTGDLTNTATVAVGSSNTDPTPGNNTASDTDTGGLPNIGLVKSCPSPADCTTVAQNPGTDVTYNIAFTNSGGIGAQNMVITDAIPANTDFKLGSATSSLGTTGLTVVIEYSSDYDALNPTLATWTYTPVSGGGGADAGYDRLVKAVRWRATAGVLSNVAPNNTGSVSFGVKIR